MEPYFIYNNIDSRNMGLCITELPAPTRAEERADVVEIPGKAGHLTMKQGENVHNSYLRECVVTAPYTADFSAILRWLTGDGKVIFSNEKNRVYEAEITAEVKFDKISNSLKQATIPFFVQPHKSQFPPESPVTITGTEGAIYNPGDVASDPIVTLDYTGSITVTMNGIAMQFISLTAPITIDCGAGIVTNADGTLWEGTYAGNFWKLAKGNNAISANNSCTLTIKPEWRWL